MNDPAAVKCPACGKPTSSFARLCVHCGSAIREPIADRGPRDPVDCPVCAHETEFVQLGGIEIDLCSRCRGAWLDHGEIDRLGEELSDAEVAASARSILSSFPSRESDGAANAARKAQVRYLACPVCRATMNRSDYRAASGIVIDSCARHGSWLDREDLRELLDIVADGRLPEIERRASAIHESRMKDRIESLEARKDQLEWENQRFRWRKWMGWMFGRGFFGE